MTQKTRNIELTQVIDWEDGKVKRVEDYLAAEEPLEMRAGRYSLGVTLRSQGDDRDLVACLLFTEGIISRSEDLVALRTAGSTASKRNLVRVYLSRSVRLVPGNAARRFSAGSACGVCGKASIAQLRRRGLRRSEAASLFDPEILCQLPSRLGAAQVVFGRTGGLHAAALFAPSGELLALREDIGRHNAVDKVIGWALLGGLLPLSGHVLLVSGRGGFEIAQKADQRRHSVAGIGVCAVESRGTTGARTGTDSGRLSARPAFCNLRRRRAHRRLRFGAYRGPLTSSFARTRLAAFRAAS